MDTLHCCLVSKNASGKIVRKFRLRVLLLSRNLVVCRKSDAKTTDVVRYSPVNKTSFSRAVFAYKCPLEKHRLPPAHLTSATPDWLSRLRKA